MTNDVDKTLVVIPEEGDIHLLRANASKGHNALSKDNEKEINEWPLALVAKSTKGLLADNDLTKKPMSLKQVLSLIDKESATTGIKPAKEKKFIVPTRNVGFIHTIDAKKELLKIEFSDIVWDKIRTWVDMTTEEISGMGCVSREKDNCFSVYDVFLLKQENSSAFTDIDDQALQELMWELIQKDDKDGGHRITDLSFWWHSHSNMGVSWSGQDDKCIAEKLQHADWWLSMVTNKRGDCNTRLDISSPALRFDNLAYKLNHEVHPTIKEFCQKEYDQKVTEISKTYSYDSRLQYPCSYDKITGYGQCKKHTQTTVPNSGEWRPPSRVNYRPISNQQQIEKQPVTLQTTNWAPILISPNTISEVPYEIKATPSRARNLYAEDLSAIVDYIKDTSEKLELGTINTRGYAFSPKIIQTGFDNDEFVTWTCSGSISCSGNHYLIIIYHDDPGIICVSEITKLCQYKNNKLAMITNSIEIPDDKFATIGIEYDPCFELEEDEFPAQAVAIIVETAKPWPENKLGQDICTDIEKVITKFEDSITKTETTSSIFQEVQKYSKNVGKLVLENRIGDIIRTADRIVLVDILKTLSSECSRDADEQSVGEDAKYLHTERIITYISLFAKRDPQQVFPWIWNCLPCKYICSQCYEPIMTENTKCPYCSCTLLPIKGKEGTVNV